ncbi:MAG TPA: TonB-dependent receptor, partial [Kofleriaceae bacterium]|nr:TonB-dependent receptor [Kofleriaceae bacterium]
ARRGDERELSAAAIADGPLPALAGARTWYAAGVAPVLVDQPLVRDAYRLTDADGDGLPDVDADGTFTRTPLHDELSRPSYAWSVPLLLRAGAERGAQKLTLTGLATYAGDTRWLSLAEASSEGVDRRTLRLDGIATWRGHWPALTATVQAAWHHAATTESPHAAGGNAPAIGYAYIPPPAPGLDDADAAVRAGCLDGGDGDLAPQLVNCPLPTSYYWTGGAGILTDAANDRPSITAELEHRIATHRLVAGVTGEDGQLVRRVRYTGGSYRQQLGDAFYLDYQQVEIGSGPGFPDDCGDAGTCRIVDETEEVYRTRYAAAWLLDRWRPIDTVELEAGLRGEHTQLGTSLVVRELLPRAGVAWDFLGGGHSRAFAGWGRYAAPMLTGTGEALFAGPTVLQTAHFGTDVSTAVTPAPAGTQVAPGTGGVRVDELVAGVEVGLADAVRAGVTARHRHLARTLEDGPTGLANPGTDGVAAATRDDTEVTFALETTPTAATTLRTGYAWSRLTGNWPGLWDPIDGASLYFSSAFDDGTAINATGPLPDDQPHRFFAELAGRGRAHGFALDGALRALASSGRPRSVRTAPGVQAFLIPRGAAGRLPAATQANVHLGARRGRVALTLDVFNAFDHRAPAAVDEVYAADEVAPIVGGTEAELPFAKLADDSGETLPVNPRYGHPTRYQAATLALLGVSVDL